MKKEAVLFLKKRCEYEHVDATLFDAVLAALAGVPVYWFFQEPINKTILVCLVLLGLAGCATGSVSDVSLQSNETFRDRVAVVATHEEVRLSVLRMLTSEFSFSFVPYPRSHFAVVLTDSYAEGVLSIHLRIRFAGNDIHRLDISEAVGEVDEGASRNLLAMLANDPATLNSIVTVVRDALVIADAQNKKYEQQRIAENR